MNNQAETSLNDEEKNNQHDLADKTANPLKVLEKKNKSLERKNKDLEFKVENMTKELAKEKELSKQYMETMLKMAELLQKEKKRNQDLFFIIPEGAQIDVTKELIEDKMEALRKSSLEMKPNKGSALKPGNN